MSSFHLQIVTPDGSFFDGEANSVVVRTTGGYVSIYPHHTDYIAALDYTPQLTALLQSWAIPLDN